MGFETRMVAPAVAGIAHRGRRRLVVQWAGRGTGQYLRGLAALVLAYYAAAHIGYAFEFSGPVAAIVWLPVGVGVAFLYLGGIRFWPGVVIGDLLVNNYSTLPVGTALGQSAGNLLEVLVAVTLLRRLCPRGEPLASLRGVGAMIAAVLCGTLVSATIGSLSSWFGGVIEGHSVPHVWRTWWLGDFSGALIVLPLALAWSSLPARPWRRVRLVEAAAMLAVVTGLSALQLSHSPWLSTLVFPALIWAALSFGARGATVAIAIVCAFAVGGATNDLGPFGIGSLNSRLLETQLFIATVSLSALAIAALVSERAQLAQDIRESRARLVEASDVARERLERDLHDGAQQRLLGLRLGLERAVSTMRVDPLEGERLASAVERQMDDVLHELRSLAHGVYPPLLRDHGVRDALRSAALNSPSDIAVRGEKVGRYPKAVEAAVYFCCLEAMQNVTKHAGQHSHAQVRLWQNGSKLHFAVSDSGPGFDPETTPHGEGMTSMRDRIEAVGGSVTIASQPGSGTTVQGRVPIG
jgi:signal transduction histidine kinase